MPRTKNAATQSALAVDLGAKHLGAWMARVGADDLPENPTGALLDMSEGGQQWAQDARRGLRGQSRRIARRKLAKRLLAVAADQLAVPVDKPEFIRAATQLMNRRGFIPRPPDYPEDENTRGEGHLPRDQRLADFAESVRQNAPLCALLKSAGVSPDDFANLAGNIANLPLRVLRRYFRETGRGKKQNRWNAPLLQKLISREINGWTNPKPKDRPRPPADILRWWRETDPSKLIPPFESNANRNPPDCPALLIRPERAANILGESGLEKVAAHLRRIRPDIAEGASENSARILQRALDWSGSANPPMRLRRQARKGLDQTPQDRAETREAASQMDSDLGDELAQRLRNFADEYYAEVRDAQNGAWDGGDRKAAKSDALLKRCDRNTPRKRKGKGKGKGKKEGKEQDKGQGKIQNLMLARVLGLALADIEKLGDFRAFLKGVKVKGNRMVHGVCKTAADLQKDHGNRLKALAEMDPKSDAGKIFPEAKVAAEELAKALTARLGREAHSQRFANPFSLAQLCNILEDGGGRAANCRTCTEENAWRSVPDAGRADGFRVAALPSDSVRPFDGILGRILSAQAERLAAEKMRHLEGAEFRPQKIRVIVEQNQFKFAEDLDDVKTRAQESENIDPRERERRIARKKQRGALALAEEREGAEKIERILADSPGICPYTGETISGRGEIDHIIPRAQTRKFLSGTSALNGEANLIRCSAEGNLQKGDADFWLADIHPEYLRKVFGANSPAEAEKRIIADVFPLLENPRAFTNFANLRRDHPEQAVALRHALFVEELRPQVARNFLRNDHKTRVNGTQKFFARKLCEALKRRFKERGWDAPKFDIVRVQARDVAAARRALLPPEWKKPRGENARQGAMSHIADAAMAYAAERGLDSEAALNAMPQSIRIVQMTRRPPWERTRKNGAARFAVFGPTMFGERFLPLLICPDETRKGFALGNSAPLPNGDETLKLLAPFLRLRAPDGKPRILKAADLPALREKAKGEKRGFIRLSVDKKTAFAKMLARWRDNDEQHAKALDILESLRFTVSKKTLNADKLKALAKTPEGELRRQFIADKSGAIVYPAFFAWADLRQQWLAAKPEERENAEQFLRRYFLDGEKSRGAKNRTVFSLPEVAPSPGPLWRVLRRAPNPQGGVFQLLRRGSAKEQGSAIASGFVREKDGRINFQKKKTALMRPLARSRVRIAPLQSSDSREAPYGAVPFGEWRGVESQNEFGVCAVSLRTKKGEMSVRLRLPVSAILEIAELCENDCRHWRDIPPALKPPKREAHRNIIAKRLALPGNAAVDWGKRFRLAALGESGGEIEIRTTATRGRELWRMFNDAASEKR